MNFEEKINKLLVKGLSKEGKGIVSETLKKYGEPLGIISAVAKWIGRSNTTNYTSFMNPVRFGTPGRIANSSSQ